VFESGWKKQPVSSREHQTAAACWTERGERENFYVADDSRVVFEGLSMELKHSIQGVKGRDLRGNDFEGTDRNWVDEIEHT
jgi:hypothetical protein